LAAACSTASRSWPREHCAATRQRSAPRGHFPSDGAVVKLLWLAIINIEDKRARERATRAGRHGVRNGYPGRLIEGQKTFGWREALNELAAAYPGRIR
jgi:putative transposase